MLVPSMDELAVVNEIKSDLINVFRYSKWEILNSKIEKFLSDIDEKYKTNYAPTGLLRIL